mgnify:CR=1
IYLFHCSLLNLTTANLQFMGQRMWQAPMKRQEAILLWGRLENLSSKYLRRCSGEGEVLGLLKSAPSLKRIILVL